MVPVATNVKPFIIINSVGGFLFSINDIFNKYNDWENK
jgi:hypothetical protein